MSNSRMEDGLRIRKEVVGAEHVDRILANTDAFSQPFQDLLNEYCWGAIWGRPGLPRKTRSLLNLALLSALNRPNEFATHVRGALTNGCSKQEIQEVLLQVTIYCGVPVGLEAFRIAQQVINEQEKPEGAR